MPRVRRSPSRSNRARRPTCSSPPIPTGWITRSGKKNINEPTRVNLLGNSIVLIAPKDSKVDNVTIAQGFDLAKLAGDGKIATGDVKSVPVGKYAKAALEKLGAWQAAEPKFAMADSVRAALTLVARGEAVLGIVYATDAKVEPGVKIVGTFPADSHPAIIYPVAATTTAKPEAAGLSRLPALDRGEDHLRKIRLHVPGQPDDLMFEISPTEWTAILLSLRVAVVATLVATPFGIALAWLLARRDFWGKAVLDAAGPSAAGAAAGRHRLSAAADLRPARPGRRVARRHLGIVFAFRWTGAALACGMMSFPLLVRPIRLSIEAIDRRLEQAASTLGAAPWQVFATVTLPLALPGMLAGMVLGFAKAIGEFGATITFVSNIPGETQTISSAIYSLIQTPDGDTAAARLVMISIAIAMARADRLRMVRAARHADACTGTDHAARRRHKAARRILASGRLRQRGPRHRPVRRLRRRQDLADQHDRRAAAARPRHHRARRRGARRHRRTACTCRRTAAASATCSRMRGCFRISTSGRISTTAGA